tara:strand:- start:273 stop:503 length:231 start_codon:yes stop_codon:yes gene_type:complete
MVIPFKKKAFQQAVFAQVELRSSFQHVKSQLQAFWTCFSCVLDHLVCIMAQLAWGVKRTCKTNSEQTIRHIGIQTD